MNDGCSACGWGKYPCFYANCMHPEGPQDGLGMQAESAVAELRTLRLALSNATRAFASGNLAALATVHPALQPLVDAAVAFANRRHP